MPISFLITGLIKSKLDGIGGLETLRKAHIILKDLDQSNELIISTYESELNEDIIKCVDKIVINNDPGVDRFRISPWPIGKNSNRYEANYKRIFETTISGLHKAQNDLVIKSRVELLPENFNYFRIWIESLTESITSSTEPKIAFLTEHYNGIIFSIDGTLGTLPNTLQFSRKEVLLETWLQARDFWLKNYRYLTRPSIFFPITDEQIVGLSYLKLFANLSINDADIKRFKRYYFSKSLVNSILFAEKNLFIWALYKNSGLTINRFKGTYLIDTSSINELIINANLKIIIRKIVKLKLKKYRHIIRRIVSGFSS